MIKDITTLSIYEGEILRNSGFVLKGYVEDWEDIQINTDFIVIVKKIDFRYISDIESTTVDTHGRFFGRNKPEVIEEAVYTTVMLWETKFSTGDVVHTRVPII